MLKRLFVERTMVKRTFFSGLIILIISICVSCGSQKEYHIKDYNLFINTTNPSLISASKRLIARFNLLAGAQVIRSVDNKEEANSLITFTSGLQERDGKLGYGQWETETTKDAPTISLQGKSSKKTIEYSMNLEFDMSYFIKRINANSNSYEGKELFLLFCHEVGHGLTLDHTNDITDVMYPVITNIENKSYDRFFQQVKDFFEI